MSDDVPTTQSPEPPNAGRLSREQIEQAFMESIDSELDTSFMDYVVAQFEKKWGPLTVAALLRVADHYAPAPTAVTEPPAPARDSTEVSAPFLVEPDVTPDALFALVALGVVLTQRTPEDEIAVRGREMLARYLASPHPRERWASALWLGRLRDERAIPLLIRMLTEYLPPHVLHYPDGSVGMFWYDSWRAEVPPLLCQLGDARLAVALRQALLAALAVEQAIPRPSGPEDALQIPRGGRLTGEEAWEWYATDCQPWIIYQHQLVYALGRLGAFGALVGVPTPVGHYDAWGTWLPFLDGEDRDPAAAAAHAARSRADQWRVEASCGFLEPGYRELVGEQSRRRYGAGMHAFSTVPDFAQAVERVLEERFGLTEAERRQAMRDYEQADFLARTTRYYEQVSRTARAARRYHALPREEQPPGASS